MLATFEQIQEMEQLVNKDVKTSFTIDSETIKGIKQIFKGHKKSSLPILNSLLFEVVNKNVIKVTYSNMDLTIEKMFLSTVNDINTLKFIIPIEVIKGLKYVKKNELFTFVEVDSNYMELNRNTVVEKFAIGSIEEYPTFNYEKENFEIVETASGYEYFEHSDLIPFIKATKSVSESETRPTLTQIAISNKTVVSTDSHRLYKSDTVFKSDRTILVNPQLVQKASEIIPANTFMKMSVSDYNVKITDDMTTNIYHRQLEGNYPDTSRLIPNEFKYEFKINNVKEIYNYMKNLKNSNVRNHVVKAHFDFKIHKMTLESDTEIGTMKIDLPIEIINVDSHNYNVNFSSKYFMTAIEQMDNEVFTWNIVAHNRPMVIKKDKSEKEIALILPVRIY